MPSTPGKAGLQVVGLGPAGPRHLTSGTLEVLRAADEVFLRTFRHPSAEEVRARRPDAKSFDGLYEKSPSFEVLYRAMADELLARSREASVVFAVPGSPAVAERSVELLRERATEASVSLLVHPAVSFLDLAFDRLALDPAGIGLRLVDAATFARSAAGREGPLLVSQVWSRSLLSEVKLSLDEPPPGQRAVILHHLGLEDEVVEEVAWDAIDQGLEPDHLTALFVPTLERPPAAELVALAETVATLRLFCPWDAAQSHRSLAPYLLEESYETLEAIDDVGEDPVLAGDRAVAHLVEELGDLLCQVVFHATLGAEEGLFNLADVARGIDSKLIERHPHVFAPESGKGADHVLENWESEKDSRLGRSHLFEGIPRALPALARVEKAERKLRSAGLGLPVDGGADLDDASLGIALLELARRGAAAGLDPEGSLRRQLDGLTEAVRQLEATASAEGRTLAEQARLTPPLPPHW